MIFIILVFIVCGAGFVIPPDDHYRLDNEPPKYEITINNETNDTYTISITHIDETVGVQYILTPNEIQYVDLIAGEYNVCLKKDFDPEEKCFTKIIKGKDKWIFNIDSI